MGRRQGGMGWVEYKGYELRQEYYPDIETSLQGKGK